MMKRSFVLIMASVALFASIIPAEAQEEEAARRWTLELGGLIAMKPIYSGSNELALAPYPFINAEYRTTYATPYAFGDEAGVKFHLPQPERPYLHYGYSYLVVGVKAGHSRDNENEAVESLLEGTPSIENSVQFFTGLTVQTRIGEFSSRLTLLPVDVNYDGDVLEDEDYSSLKVAFDYLIGGNVDPKLVVYAALGINWMNNEYAEAYYGLRYPGVKLDAFEAEGGMNDFHGMIGARYMFSKHVSSDLMLSGAKLLGDAADSPLTKSEFQPNITSVISYRF